LIYFCFKTNHLFRYCLFDGAVLLDNGEKMLRLTLVEKPDSISQTEEEILDAMCQAVVVIDKKVGGFLPLPFFFALLSLCFFANRRLFPPTIPLLLLLLLVVQDPLVQQIC
jgi:hypothetical protein